MALVLNILGALALAVLILLVSLVGALCLLKGLNYLVYRILANSDVDVIPVKQDKEE